MARSRVIKDGPPEERPLSSVSADGKDLTFAGFRQAADFPKLSSGPHTAEPPRGSEPMRVLRQLAGGVAHDFNNLLTVINSSASLLLATEGLAPPAVDSTPRITVAGERADQGRTEHQARRRRGPARPSGRGHAGSRPPTRPARRGCGVCLTIGS